jgi:hypothetical protein
MRELSFRKVILVFTRGESLGISRFDLKTFLVPIGKYPDYRSVSSLEHSPFLLRKAVRGKEDKTTWAGAIVPLSGFGAREL